MEEVVAFYGLAIAKLYPPSNSNDFGPKFHSKKSPRNGPHFEGGERPRNYGNPMLSNGFEYRFEILFRIDQ